MKYYIILACVILSLTSCRNENKNGISYQLFDTENLNLEIKTVYDLAGYLNNQGKEEV